MASFVSQTPTGTVNGINKTFTLSTGTAEIYINGLLQSSSNYTLSTSTTTGTATATLTFVPGSIPRSGDSLTAWIYNQ